MSCGPNRGGHIILETVIGAPDDRIGRDQMKWVGIMNTCKAQVEEIIYNELIYED